jgi:hypothetical protein
MRVPGKPQAVCIADIAVEFGGRATAQHGKTADFERVDERTAPCKGYFRLWMQDTPRIAALFSPKARYAG